MTIPPTFTGSSNDVLIRCENVGKKFCRDLKKSLWYGVKDSFSDMFSGRGTRAEIAELRSGEFWANKDINFEVKRGECLGLIGRNGAGKTTLLKMINGLIKPDAGRIEMKGRLGAMIALGAGFNPVLTAMENILVNGSILGMSKKQISDRLDEIIEFSELHDFMNSPVRTFSSGMQVRLGFAVAAILIKPDVLLLDEVLAVGDFRYRNKCMNRLMDGLRDYAAILVSHQQAQVRRVCNKALLLEKGKQVMDGAVESVFNRYESSADKTTEDHGFIDSRIADFRAVFPQDLISFNGNVCFLLAIKCDQRIGDVMIRVVVKTLADEVAVEWNSQNHGHTVTLPWGMVEMQFEITNLRLRAGEYQLEIEICTLEENITLLKRRLMQRITTAPSQGAKFLLHPSQA